MPTRGGRARDDDRPCGNHSTLSPLTDKEKRELKGPDPTLPGYTGDFDSLKVDQTVQVYVAKQPPKSKTKDSDADSTDSTRPKIAMIVIPAEGKN